jgi:hypothetical protein
MSHPDCRYFNNERDQAGIELMQAPGARRINKPTVTVARATTSMSSRSRWLLATLVSFVLAIWGSPALAQNNPTRFEIGAGFASLWQQSESGPFVPSPGLWVSFGTPLAHRLSLESQLAWFPTSTAARFKDQGGQALQFGVGVRGIFFENRRVAFSGLVLPGLVRFSNTVTDIGTLTDPAVIGPATHLALGLGLGFDVRLSDRISARIDALSTLYAYSGTPDPQEPGFQISMPSAVAQRWRMSAGVAYRLGAIRPPAAAAARRVEGTCNAGLQFAAVVLPSGAQQEIRREPGLAGFVSCRVAEHIFADGAVTTFPRDAPANNEIGGSMLHAFGGVKAGTQRGRIGFFGRAAVGIVRHSNVVTSFDPGVNPPVLSAGPLNTMAWQFGGVIEVYLAPRWLLRIDAIDMIIPEYVSQGVYAGLDNGTVVPGTHAIVLNFGVGWRF